MTTESGAPAARLRSGIGWGGSHNFAARQSLDRGLDREGRRFPLRSIRRRHFFIGTREAVKEAMERTGRLLHARRKTEDEIDMEPYEVLRDIIKGEKYHDVGGVPQIAKVFRHMNTQFYATLWKCADEKIRPHVYGRPLQDHENINWPYFDPDTLRFDAHQSDIPVMSTEELTSSA